MDTVKELQHSLSQLIYSITDVRSLSKIKSAVDRFIKPTEDNVLPWEKATLSMKRIASFEDVVKSQGDKNLTFEELYPFIDESESDYTVEDLLAALN
ncbi:MAG: hypothetical protein R2795_05230 [Saprospiraceae bacterium]